MNSILRKLAAPAAVILAFCAVSFSQGASKVAVVDTDAFSDPATGIKRLLNGAGQVESEFKPLRDEVAALKTRLDAATKAFEDAQRRGDGATAQKKADEAESLKKDVSRKAEEGQARLQRRYKEVTDPIFADIAKELETYARAKGFDLVLDLARVGGSLMVLNSSIDITKGFVAEYNKKYP